MSPRRTAATMVRVLRQLQHDPRTVGLIIIVPCLLILLLKYMFDGQSDTFNALAPLLLGIFPLLLMFLVTSIATLRERTSGTLDRLMTLPISKLDFIFGYALAFGLIALIQAAVLCLVAIGLFGLVIKGMVVWLIIAAVLAGLLGTSLGLLVSAFATSEFQAVQLVMPILIPQVLFCGLFVPRDHMAKLLRWLSDVLPVTYSVDAMKEIANHADITARLVRDLGVVAGFAVAAVILGSITIRRTS